VPENNSLLPKCFFDAKWEQLTTIILKLEKVGMRLRSAINSGFFFTGLLVAALIHAASNAHAEEPGLLSAPEQSLSVPASTQNLPEPGTAQPQAAPAPPSSGPLRVVIPNLREQAEINTAILDKNMEKVEAAAAAKSATQQSMEVLVETPHTAQPPKVPTIERASQALYAGTKDVWNNAVLLADMGQKFVKRAIFKPNVAFAPLPAPWQVAAQPENGVTVASDAEALSNLAPAAGEPEKPLLQQQPVSQQVQAEQIQTQQAITQQIQAQQQQVQQAAAKPVIIQPSPTPQPAIQPRTQETNMVAQAAAPLQPAYAPQAADPTEPAPVLSAQSKNIANKIPKVADEKFKETAKNVAIERHKNSDPTVLNKGAADTAKPIGLKIGEQHVKMDVNYELGRAYDALMAGNSDIAIQIYEDILTSEPKNQDALFGLASTYHRAGQIDTARALYGKLLELNPKHRDGLNNFLVLLSDEAPQEALEQMERLESQNPGFSPIPAQMAIIYQKLGNRDKAVDKMYRALAISPENITYRYNLAIMLDKNGNYDKAAQLYAQILDASNKGQIIPGDARKIQQRLTFIRSNSRR